MKKNILIALNVFLVFLMGFATYFLYRSWHQRLVSDFIVEQQEKRISSSKTILQEGNIGTTHILAYLPTDQEGNAIQLVQESIQEFVAQEIGQEEPSGKIEKIVVITTQDNPTAYSNVRQVEVKKEEYLVDYFSVEEGIVSSGESLLLTDKEDLFTFETLFKNPEKTKKILATTLKADLEAKATDEALVADMEAKFAGLDIKQVPFTYQNSQFTFDLSTVEATLPSLTTGVDQFYDVVQGRYLSAQDGAAFEAYKEKKAKEKMIALTFDDGPNPATTPMILDVLKQHDAKATFFILGQNIPGNEEILKRIVADGHEVANHTWTHPDLAGLSPEQIKQEIDQTQEAIKEITGQTPVVMRPPYGSFNKTVMDTMGLPAIHWSVDTLDWQSRDPQAILQIVQSSTYPGSIILMHDIHQPSADSLPAVMEFLVSQDYTFGTVSDLLGDELNPQHVYYDRTRNEPAQ